MRRFHFLPATLCVFLSGVNAALEEFHYAAPVDNQDGKCPGMAWGCPIPQVCARDTLLDKYYCCMPDQGGICWTGATTCAGAGENEPSSSQIGCDSGEYAFCCLDKREECTQTSDQINICWSTQTNPMLNITAADSNRTFSSLLAASPSATTLRIDLLGVSSSSSSSATPTPSGASSDSASVTPASGSASTTPTSSSGSDTEVVGANESSSYSKNDSDNGLSGGAIGGIVVGAVAGLALILVGAFALWRRNKKDHDMIPPAEMAANPYTDNTAYNGHNGNGEYYGETTKWAHTASHEVPQHQHHAVEMDANSRGPVAELPTPDPHKGGR